MNIEEFYDEDERRRESQELELGSDWHDAGGARYEVSFVVDTGELYAMAAPPAMVGEDVFGDVEPMFESVNVLTVDVLARLSSVDELHQALGGWEDHMGAAASLEWLKEQVRAYPAA